MSLSEERAAIKEKHEVEQASLSDVCRSRYQVKKAGIDWRPYFKDPVRFICPLLDGRVGMLVSDTRENRSHGDVHFHYVNTHTQSSALVPDLVGLPFFNRYLDRMQDLIDEGLSEGRKIYISFKRVRPYTINGVLGYRMAAKESFLSAMMDCLREANKDKLNFIVADSASTKASMFISQKAWSTVTTDYLVDRHNIPLESLQMIHADKNGKYKVVVDGHTYYTEEPPEVDEDEAEPMPIDIKTRIPVSGLKLWVGILFGEIIRNDEFSMLSYPAWEKLITHISTMWYAGQVATGLRAYFPPASLKDVRENVYKTVKRHYRKKEGVANARADFSRKPIS